MTFMEMSGADGEYNPRPEVVSYFQSILEKMSNDGFKDSFGRLSRGEVTSKNQLIEMMETGSYFGRIVYTFAENLHDQPRF